MPDARLGQPDPAGDPELREVLAAYLGRVRGVRAEPGQIVITSGARHGIGLVWAALAARGARRVAIERPGWHGVRETVVEAGLEPVPLPVDADGLEVDALARDRGRRRRRGRPRAPVPDRARCCRRSVASSWRRGRAAAAGSIVEDDYDAEYRYDRQPIGCLQGLAPEHVAYAGLDQQDALPALGSGGSCSRARSRRRLEAARVAWRGASGRRSCSSRSRS